MIETLDFEGLRNLSKSNTKNHESSLDDGSKEMSHESPRGKDGGGANNVEVKQLKIKIDMMYREMNSVNEKVNHK